MNTWLLTIDELNDPFTLRRLGDILKSGGLVVFPTETVYGIGANALDPQAAKRIYVVKGRPSDNPLIVHIAKPEDVYSYAETISEDALRLMEVFWPGPLTLILQKKAIVPDETTAGLHSVAVRCPGHDGARRLIRAAGVPIAAPSANISGRPSATRFDHVKEDMMGLVDAIIDGGSSDIGLESTVLDVSIPTPTILRPGAVTKEMLETVLKKSVSMGSLSKESDAPKSPGMKYVHYAPKGEVTVLYGNIEDVARWVNDTARQDLAHASAVICSNEETTLFAMPSVLGIGSRSRPETIAKELFSALREMDNRGIERIYIPAFSEADLGAAIMNRLLKAAGYRTLRLDKNHTKNS